MFDKKKKIIIYSLILAFCGIMAIYSIYGCIQGIKPFDVSFPIGFSIFALISAYALYLCVTGKEFPLNSRFRVKRVIKYCTNPKNDYVKCCSKLERFLNSRHKFSIKFCPVCGKSSCGLLMDKPCKRCKTHFAKEVEKFILERKSYSKHRLESLYNKDYTQLSYLISKYNPTTNVTDSYDGNDININITITR